MRKTTFFKTLLVAACLCLGSMSAWADPIETIGSSESGWWTAFSDTYTLEGYGKYHFQFTTTNVNDGNVYKTWLLFATNGNDSHGGGGTEYFVWRGEGYAWGQGTNSNDTPSKLVCSNTYSTSNPTGAGIQAAMNGASVDMVITRESNNIYATATVTPSNGENEFTMSFSYLYGNATSANVGLFLTVENAQVVLNTAEQTAEWSTVWSTDFSSAPSGLTYTISNGGQVSISNCYLMYDQYSGSGGRTGTTTFTGSEFSVDTDWILDFDWNCSGGNTEAGSGTFSTSNTTGSTAFTLTYTTYGSKVTIKDAAGNNLTTTLPGLAYANRANGMTAASHFTLKGVVDDGIYLTVTNGGVTYINNVKVTSDYGYPKTFVNVAAKNLGRCYLDNISFYTPAVAGYVAPPTSTITGASGTSRKFTLSCLTDGATIYYATSDLEKGAAGWDTYSGEVTTDAATIYAYAEDAGHNTSDKMNFATGAGTTIDLLPATVTHSNNGVYTIASNQSAILGSPTATIHYQIDGGSEQTSTNASVNVNIVADGTLTYWLTAEGYGATDPEDETVYAPRAYAVTTTLNFCTNSTASAAWAYGNATDYNLSTITVATVNTDRTYYKYLDQSSNIIGDGLLAVSAVNAGSSWRIDKNNAGVHPYYKTEYVVLLGMEAGQLIQIAASSAPSNTSNLTVVPAGTYPGTYTYTATADGEVIFSLAKDVVLKTIKLCETTVSKTITAAAGWATYCSPYALDFSSSIANLTKAYIVTGATGSTLDLEEITGKVPANTGILLEGEGKVVIPVAASADAVVGNKLVGVTAEYALAAKAGYVLMGSPKVGFYNNTNDFTVGANTAYLPANFAEARSFFGFDDDETTALTLVNSEKRIVNNDYFDLQGRRVAQPTKGLYIVNGRKIVIK